MGVGNGEYYFDCFYGLIIKRGCILFKKIKKE